MTDFSQIGFKRDDIHTPVNFLPENYHFVGCFHNTYSFKSGRFNTTRDQLLALLALNDRPNGPDASNCDHCGAAIAFVGVFQHKDGDYIAVGSTCAENRFPLSNAEFQRLRKEHRLSRNRDLRIIEWNKFMADHTEVDWTAAVAFSNAGSTSAHFAVRQILAEGAKYGSLFDYKLDRLIRILTPVAPVPAPVAPPVDPDQAKAQAFLRAYSGSNGFLNSLKSQVEAGRTLSPRQLECALKNVQEAEAPQVPKVDNSRLSPGIYVNAEGHVYKVQGNQAFKSAAKRQAKDSTAPDPFTVHGAFVYAKVWGHSDGSRINLSEVGDLSSGLHSLWIYERGLINQLVVDHRMTLTEARTFGELYSQCVNCGRTLTDEKSIDAAIGPVCIKQFPDWGHQELDHNHKEA